MRLWFSVVLLASLAVGAPGQHPGQGVNFYSREKEAALGAQLAQQLRQRTTPLDSVPVRGFVDQIGRKLAAQLPGAGISYTFTVVADDIGGSTHEPASVPGGYIFVPAVLILTVRDEAEFAGMLAHAMAHVAARHGTRQGSRGEMVNMANMPLVFAGGWTGLAGDGQEAAVPISFLTLQRAYEAEADVLAVKITSGAGYDPESLVRYISRTQTHDTPRSKVFSALPTRESRIAGMQKAIQELPPGTYSSSDQFPPIQREVRRLTPNKVRSAPSLLHPNE
jgi:beta-barrel assembly-enhancing protease